jgi:hypothetical protein
MDPRVEKLIEAFESKGWKYIGSTDTSSDWWFTEILQLTSTWRPVGTSIYLTLLTDPCYSKEKVVWCISISSIIPQGKPAMPIDSLTLNDIKRTDLPAFVDKINRAVLNDQ